MEKDFLNNVYCIAIANVGNRDVNETLACELVNNIDVVLRNILVDLKFCRIGSICCD